MPNEFSLTSVDSIVLVGLGDLTEAKLSFENIFKLTPFHIGAALRTTMLSPNI